MSWKHPLPDSIRFSLVNTGDEEIEIITASGSSASPDIRWYLQDLDGNVLASVPFRQLSGGNPYVVQLANGNTVARIPAGERFEADPTTLPVPANAPDTVVLRWIVDHLYSQYGKATQVTMNGLSGTHQVALIDTSYYGEVLEFLLAYLG